MLDEPWKSKVTGVVQPEVAPWRADVTRPPSLADSVLRLIWDERAISRADIARRTGLSRSTVSEVVTELLATRLVDEAGEGASSGGRRPIVLEFQDDACVILGVDMGATHVSVALTDLRGRVLAWENRPFPVRSDPEGTRALIAEFCAECLRSWGGDPARLVGIGIAVPCPVDPRHQGRFSTHVLPAWKGRAGFEALGARFGAPIFIDNDANLGAVAERWWGAGRGFDDFTYIKVATGVGAGHMVGGRIARPLRGPVATAALQRYLPQPTASAPMLPTTAPASPSAGASPTRRCAQIQVGTGAISAGPTRTAFVSRKWW